MKTIASVRGYQLDPEVEAQVVWLLCTSPTFWESIGRHTQETHFDSPSRETEQEHKFNKLLIRAALGFAREAGRGSSKLAYVLTYLSSNRSKWQLTVEDVKAVETYARELGDKFFLEEISEKEVVTLLIPELKSYAVEQAAKRFTAVYTASPEKQNEKLKSVVEDLQTVMGIGQNSCELGDGDELEALKLAREKPDTVTFQINALDQISSPMQPGKFGLVFTETSGGKSTFLGQIGAALSWQGYNTFYASFEDDWDLVMHRYSSSLTDIEFKYILDNTKIDEVVFRLARLRTQLGSSLGRMRSARFRKHVGTIQDIEKKIDALEQKYGEKIRGVVVDYVELVGDHGKSENEQPHVRVRRVAEQIAEMAALRNMWAWSAQQAHEAERTKGDFKVSGLTKVYNGKGAIKAADIVIGLEPSANHSMVQIRTSKWRSGSARQATEPLPTEYSLGRLVKPDRSYLTIFPEESDGQTGMWAVQ